MTHRPADAAGITRGQGWWTVESLNERVRPEWSKRGRETILAVRRELPEGQTDLWVVNEGPRARPVSPKDRRVVSVLMTDWDLSRLPSGRETVATSSR